MTNGKHWEIFRVCFNIETFHAQKLMFHVLTGHCIILTWGIPSYTKSPLLTRLIINIDSLFVNQSIESEKLYYSLHNSFRVEALTFFRTDYIAQHISRCRKDEKRKLSLNLCNVTFQNSAWFSRRTELQLKVRI